MVNSAVTIGFQSPTEICSHSDADAVYSRPESYLCSCFNLLRRYAVIPTANRPDIADRAAVFQSPTEICGHSDPTKMHLSRASNTFQSPTEICGHSDRSKSSPSKSSIWFQSPTEICGHSDSTSCCVASNALGFQSPTEICGHSDADKVDIAVIPAALVSISYGDMRSFRRQTEQLRATEIDQFQSPTEICGHSDNLWLLLMSAIIKVGFNLLRRYAVIPTRWHRRLCHGPCRVSISYGDMRSFRQPVPFF